jgi:uncharacterized membrane protein
MAMRVLIFLFLMAAGTGCILFQGHQSISLESEVVPSKVSLAEPEPLSVEVQVGNIGKSTVKVKVDVGTDEGLRISNPPKTDFTIKPEGSRIVIFNASLEEDAVPGDYVIDVKVTTDKGEVVTGVAKLRVVQKKGLI